MEDHNGVGESEILWAYIKAVNEIDDYFEYMYQSQDDRDFVYAVLTELALSMEQHLVER
ncbi:hypothetical protein [Vibrio sp. CB1-14]|uniref:Uncharacterized protein n=1 Tax=Vibrio chaetopteri TaxID=3016528 RepID=A0AAU8BS41_9VIBR